MTTRDALHVLALAWEAHTEPDLEAGTLDVSHCILATRTLGAVLSATAPSLSWRAVPCAARALNPQGAMCAARRLPVEQWPPDAWAVGIDPREPCDPGRYPGHLVLEVEDLAGDLWLLDASLGQLSRPQRGMPLPRTWVWRLERDWLVQPGHVHAQLPGGATVEYQPWPDLGQLHRNAADWRMNWRPRAAAILEVLGHGR